MKKVLLGLLLGLPLGVMFHLLGREAGEYNSSNRWHSCMDYRKSKGLEPLPYCWRTFSAKCSPLWEELTVYQPEWWDDHPEQAEIKDPEDGKCSYE